MDSESPKTTSDRIGYTRLAGRETVLQHSAVVAVQHKLFSGEQRLGQHWVLPSGGLSRTSNRATSLIVGGDLGRK
jgi:hypothetical protein